MFEIINEKGEKIQIPENEAYRTILTDRLEAYIENERSNDEKELLKELSNWLSKVQFA